MTDRLSDAQFDDNVFSFLTFGQEQGWDEQEGALGQCGIATGTFRDASVGSNRVQGMPHTGTHTTAAEFKRYTGDQSRAHPLHKTSVVPPPNWEHAANIVNTASGMYVVDWTARQFDTEADFPHVVSVDEFKQNWEKAGPLE